MLLDTARSRLVCVCVCVCVCKIACECDEVAKYVPCVPCCRQRVIMFDELLVV